MATYLLIFIMMSYAFGLGPMKIDLKTSSTGYMHAISITVSAIIHCKTAIIAEFSIDH